MKWMLVVLASLCWVVEDTASAAKMMVSHAPPTENRPSSSSDLMMDVSVHYVRDTQAGGATDTAARFSLGGMFTSLIGLDVQGLYETRSKNYLVGGDIRLAVTDWFFMKGGIGGYSDKQTQELKLTPIAGAGIMAHMNRDFYLVTEGSYFQVTNQNNLSFGVGLGCYF
jgi:hypothetical protein